MPSRHSILLLILVATPVAASHVTISGNMDATMSRGETRTFTPELDFTGAFNGELRILITADQGLILGGTSTDAGPLTCVEQRPTAHVCSGNVSFSAGSSLRITQPLTLSQEAVGQSSPGGYSAQQVTAARTLTWTIQPLLIHITPIIVKIGSITITTIPGHPQVVMTKKPENIVAGTQLGVGTGSTSFELTNVGDAATTVSLQKRGNPTLFSLEPAGPIELAPGASREISFVAGPAPAEPGGRYLEAFLTGEGVNSQTPQRILIIFLVKDRPASLPVVRPESNRIDVPSAPGSTNPEGVAKFQNSGSGPASGLVSSDVPWLIPADEVITIEPGETKEAKFTIDVAMQAELLAPSGGIGSLSGKLTLRHLLPAVAKTALKIAPLQDQPGTAISSVTVVSTIKAAVTPGTIPPLPSSGSILFIPGVGRVIGSVGLFISDLSVFAQSTATAFRSRAVVDTDLYFTPLGGGTTQKATLPALAPPNVMAIGDVIGSDFAANQIVGSLQIRVPGLGGGDALSVGLNANVFNVSNPGGTYGTTIPVFRLNVFDCPQGRDRKFYIPGLRKDASGHTNFYVQEICGQAAKVTLDFHDAGGARIGSTTVDVPPFAAIQLGQATLTEGAVSAVLSHAAGSVGGFVAYATPVDRASGDTWALVGPDFLSTNPVLIPVAGAVRGANNTYFRTDVAIMNVSSAPRSGTLRFYNRNGEVTDRSINLNPLQTQSISDVTTTLFGVTTDNVGYLVFTPAADGTFVITSRTYTTVGGSTATFGTAVPTRELFTALLSGAMRRIGGLDDAAISTVSTQRPGTFRTNFGLIETTGRPASVRVTLYYTFPATAAALNNSASATYDLAPRQFLLLSNIANTIIGAEARARLGDLRNMQVEFEVIGGTGRVVPFVTSVDNGTGDSTFRVE